MSLGSASLCLTIGMAGAIVTYIPAGMAAERIGRRRTILGGVLLLFLCFLGMFFLTLRLTAFHPILYIVFILVGIAWASINVNSLPMVVEMCASSDIGKFTGYYYAFSMAAQIITPIAAGLCMHHLGYRSLFPYAAIASFLAIVTMRMVRHGDARLVRRSKENSDSA